MISYRFVLRSHGGQVEDLGHMGMRDDREAIAFGESVVREMVADSPTPDARGLLEVIDGARVVGRIQSE
jgi:hypothetical protein